MKLIVGLGNPGLKYKNTRHNAGFLVLETLFKGSRLGVMKSRYSGLFTKGTMKGEKAALFMPQTYMNLSGPAVLAAARKEKVGLSRLLVICDDISLPIGSIRLRKKGSSGGHNGLESIIESLGTGEFARLRIGIGPEHPPRDMAKFVLEPFERDEKPGVDVAVKKAVSCLLVWLKDGPDRAMTLFNGRQLS